ncbi:alpha/beta hydrolase family protein [Glaciecola sp. MF2-115]|uniref:alpha/beta hydrolase family protein n=1 Tax=Glaciecola sp. MF2-115 TaxID=3384827 RepID=UPI0039A16867
MRKILCIILFILPSLAFAQQLPIANFVKEGDYLDMTLSPDGKHISARVRIDGKVNLIFLETSTMKPVGGVTPNENDEIHSAVWISNERVVYQFQESTIYFDSPRATGELFAINVDGSSNKFLYGYRAEESTLNTRLLKRKRTYATPEIISVLEDDDRHILILEYPWSTDGFTYFDDRMKDSQVTKLNVYSGKKIKVETLPHAGATAFATPKGEIKFMTWKDDNDFYHSASRENEESEWKELPLSEQSRQNLVITNINKAGDKAFAWGTVGDKEIYTLFELDLKTGAYTQLFEGMSTDIEDIILDPATGAPVVGISHPAQADYHYTKTPSKTANLHKALLSSFGGQVTDFASISEDGSKILVRIYSEINPGEYYLFDANTKQAKFLWANRSWLDPRQMASATPFKFETEDNIELNGYVTMPVGLAKDQKAPLVVMIHGGPQARDFLQFNGEVQLLANRGYAVMQVNFRGSDGYGAAFRRAGYLEWGGKMIKDIIDATHHVTANFNVDSERMCTYGASYGGYAALMATVRAPDLYKCTIGYVGIYDLNYAYTESYTTRLLGGQAYLERVLGTDTDILNEFSPVNHADKIKAKVMLIHGEKDARVPVINAEKMLEKLEEAGHKVPYLNFSKSGHGVRDPEGRLELYAALLKHLEENIGE